MGKTIQLKNNQDNDAVLVERTRSITDFLSEAKNKRVFTQVEIDHLFWLIRGNDKKAAENAVNKLVAHNQLFVYALAKKYSSDPELIMDLVQEGNTGLLLAIQSYDPTKGYKFLTYAVHYIRREMTQYITEMGLVQKPNQFRTCNTVPKARHDFFSKNQRNPTDEELTEILEEEYGIKISDVSDTYDVKLQSIDETLYDDKGKTVNAGESEEFNAATASQNLYMEECEKEEVKRVASVLLSTLDTRTADIVRKFFGIGYDYEMTPEDIGDFHNMTPERVRQIVKEAIRKLKNLNIANSLA